jgi:uncharacterized membrane protein YesL
MNADITNALAGLMFSSIALLDLLWNIFFIIGGIVIGLLIALLTMLLSNQHRQD